MRLFVAINFDDRVIKNISKIRERLKLHSKQGRFVRDEHLHLTLEFLGEISEDRLEDIKSVMKDINANPFNITLSRLGYFKGREGHIYWLGLLDNKDLINLQNKLHLQLLDKGFKLDKREYKPHITIGRRVKLKDNLDIDGINEDISKISFKVDSISLMESTNIAGKLIYKVIYSKHLS